MTVTMVVFSLFNIVMGFSARRETQTAFNSELLSDRNQLMLYGLSLLLTFLAAELSVFHRILGTASLSGQQWLACFIFALTLLLVDEVIKFFLRQRRGQDVPVPMPATITPAEAH